MSSLLVRMLRAILLAIIVALATSNYCDEPSPAFPLPNFTHHEQGLQVATNRISEALQVIASKQDYNKTSFSISITSQAQTLYDFHHTADIRSTLRPGAKVINNETCYRIASMTKPFTVLALLKQEKAGNLSLDDSILKYIPALNAPQNGTLPWKDITIRSLASQIAGIPRDLAQVDMVNDPELSASLGLPHVSKHEREELHLPACDEMVNYTRACNASDLLEWVKKRKPLFAPNQKSSYSNINFDLLGLVIANVTGMSYEEYIEGQILKPIGMDGSSFSTPSDEVAAVPAGIEYYWPFEIGVQNPTGGLYSSSGDLSKWLRYVLSTYNAQTHALSWFNPTSVSGSIETFYGMPWEIYRVRTRDVLEEEDASSRPLTFITKGGGLPGYSSVVIMIPEYGLGITILVAGNGMALEEIREVVVKEIVSFAEEAALTELAWRYEGIYADQPIKPGNISNAVTLSVSTCGLTVKSWVSNGVDTKMAVASSFAKAGDVMELNVLPTLLYVDEENQKGERWRVVPRKLRSKNSKISAWDNFCIADWDIYMYAGEPFNEIVFWGSDLDGQVEKVELSAFRIVLPRQKGDSSGAAIVQQISPEL